MLVFNFGKSVVESKYQKDTNKLILKYLGIGVILKSFSKKYISRARVIPKALGGIRVVIDMRFVNTYTI